MKKVLFLSVLLAGMLMAKAFAADIIQTIDPDQYLQERAQNTWGLMIYTVPYLGTMKVDSLGYPKSEWMFLTGLSYSWYFGAPDREQIEKAIGRIAELPAEQRTGDTRDLLRKQLSNNIFYCTLGAIGPIMPMLPYAEGGYLWMPKEDVKLGSILISKDGFRIKLGVMATPTYFTGKNNINIYPVLGISFNR